METRGKRFYKPDDESYWEWSDSVDTLKGDCEPNERIVKERDEHGRWYYQHVRRMED